VEIEIGGDAVEWDLNENDLDSHDDKFESEWDERSCRADLVRSGGQRIQQPHLRVAEPDQGIQRATLYRFR